MNRREFLSIAAQCMAFAGVVSVVGGLSSPVKAGKEAPTMTQWIFDGVNGLSFELPTKKRLDYKVLLPIVTK